MEISTILMTFSLFLECFYRFNANFENFTKTKFYRKKLIAPKSQTKLGAGLFITFLKPYHLLLDPPSNHPLPLPQTVFLIDL